MFIFLVFFFGIVAILVLKVYPYVGMSLCNLHVPSGFGGRGGSEVNTVCVSPQGALAAIALVGDGAGVGGARATVRC